MVERTIVAACAVLLARHASAICPSAVTTAEFYVDPVRGSDEAAGTFKTPFLTVAKGVQQAKAARNASSNVVVNLLAGDHDVSSVSVSLDGNGKVLNTCPDVFSSGGRFTLKGVSGNRLLGGKPFA